MNKRHLHHFWKQIRAVSYWYFLAAFLAFGLLFVFNYRQNNVNMIKLRDKVFVVDEQDGDIEKALRDLREYVYGHMNTRLVTSPTAIRPPIQLKHEYERRVAAEKAKADTTNANLRKEAEGICKQKFPTTANATGIQPCIEGYINEKGVAPQPVLKEFYQFDFVSPTWSPDVAGWSLVFAAIFGLMFIVRYGLERWLRHELHDHA